MASKPGKDYPAKRAPKPVRRPVTRDMRREPHSSLELDNAAKITAADVEHAAATFRKVAPETQRTMLQAPLYEGDGAPSDDARDL